MRALVHDPDAPHGLRLGEAPGPEPGPAEALVQVSASSLNFAFQWRRFPTLSTKLPQLEAVHH